LYRRVKGYKFETSAILGHLGWIDAPHTQNFEIELRIEISRANSGVKKLKSVLKFLYKW
jgi:hypothetical protein